MAIGKSVNKGKGVTSSLKVALAPVLLALLLSAQFSPAAAGFAAKFSLETGYASFESDGPENFSPDVDPPDFLLTSAILSPGNVACLAQVGLLSASNNALVSIPAIRAPPRPVLNES